MIKNPKKAVIAAAKRIASGSGICAFVQSKIVEYPPMAIKPACPKESWPVIPQMMFTLKAIIALIPAKEKICAV